MNISRQNAQLLYTLLIVAVVGGVVGYVLNKGVSKIGEKEIVLGMADELMECKSQEDYFALLHKKYPPKSRMWKAPAMTAEGTGTSTPATLEFTPDGEIKIVVGAMRPDQFLVTRSYVYLPATLVDDTGRSYRLLDIRVNSRKVDLVFEYIFAVGSGSSKLKDRRFSFCFGLRRWDLVPRAGP